MSKPRRQPVEDLSRYFLLYPDASTRFEGVADYDLGSLDVTVFWSGKKFFGGDLASLSIRLTRDQPSDCLGNPMSWLIVSSACVTALTPLTSTQAQLLPIPVLDYQGVKHVGRYQVVNPLGCVDAIDGPRKRRASVSLAGMVLDAREIPGGLNIFRLKHKETVIVVSTDAIRCIRQNKFQGFAASPTGLHPA